MKAKRFLPAATGLAMLLTIARAGEAAEAEAKPACGSSISACGCTINQSGTYTVVNDLNASQGLTPKGDCIDVAASYVQLNVQGATVIGNGTGVGIRVLGPAHHASSKEGITAVH